MSLASSVMDIFFTVVAPVLTVIALGVCVQRWQPLNVQTLTRLNIYFFIPVFLFVKISNSQLAWSDMAGVAVVVLAPMAVLGVSMFALLRTLKINAAASATMLVGGIFFNAGNFGIPVAYFAFGEKGEQVQSLVIMFMNTSIFLLGYGILAVGHGRGVRSVLGYFKLPMIYSIVAALLVKEGVVPQPADAGWTWLDEALKLIAGGMVPVALITLAAQLAQQARWPRWRIITPAIVIKLLLFPALTAGVIALLDSLGWDLWPWPGAQLILGAAGPTAVNTLLLTIELDGDSDAAADCVFWTTVFCAVTVTTVLAVIRFVGGDALVQVVG